jgi:hypothetical protein
MAAPVGSSAPATALGTVGTGTGEGEAVQRLHLGGDVVAGDVGILGLPGEVAPGRIRGVS